MDKLLPELLAKVLLCLPPSDRLNSALTCHRWAQVMSTSSLLKDVRLEIRGFEMEEAKAVLFSSDRQYRNLKLSKAHLFACDSGFWSRIGKNLRELDLNGSLWSSQVFFFILRQCSKLESLRISGGAYSKPPISMTNFEIPGGTCLEEIQDSTRFIHHLHLDLILTGDILTHLLTLMPNVTSISLGCFPRQSDFVSRLPRILGTNRVITKLDHGTRLSNENWIELMRLSSASLRCLRVVNDDLPREAYEAISKCTKLRNLSLEGNPSLEDDDLKTLLLNNRGLETLFLGGWCNSLTDEGFAHILSLQELWRLSLLSKGSAMSSEFLCSLGNMSSLRHLNLISSEIDVTILRSLRKLPNLETLRLCCYGWTSEILEVLFENFKHLKKLDLTQCGALTDGDLARLRAFKDLKRFSFIDFSETTERSFENGFGTLDLERLVVSYGGLTDAALASIAAHHGRLKSLVLACCDKFTDAGLVTLLRNEPLLRELQFEECSVTGEFLNELADLCPELRSLSFAFCDEMSDSAVDSFSTRRPEVDIYHPGRRHAL